MNRPDLSVIVPVYNEQHRILAAIDDMTSYLAAAPEEWEVLFVDDGSRDRTREILRDRVGRDPRLRLIELGSNQGKGEAIRRGVLAAQGKYVLFRDADTSVAMSEFDRFRRLVRDGAPVIIASRQMPGAVIAKRQPGWREAAGKCFTLLCRALLVHEVRDYTCGFKCFSAEAAREIFSRQKVRRWAFDAEIVFLAKKLGYSISQVPITWVDSPGTKVRILLDAVRSFLDILKILGNHALGRYRLSKP